MIKPLHISTLFRQSLIKKINNYVYMCLEVQSAYVNVKALLEAKIKINWNVVIYIVIINIYEYTKFRLGRYETPKFRIRHVVYWKQRSRGHGWYRLFILLCFSTIYSTVSIFRDSFAISPLTSTYLLVLVFLITHIMCPWCSIYILYFTGCGYVDILFTCLFCIALLHWSSTTWRWKNP